MPVNDFAAELVVQALALDLSQNSQGTCQPCTRLAMVRFGNVLGSSGSVVPLFRKQIAAGSPITLTHPEIIRFFMTIPEAAQLVLQSSVLAKGGDVFLLDMGEPVRIKDLAEQMLRLSSGLSLRDARNPNGDIEIVCTGLRPGEKLYEELLIDAECEATSHPLIYRAQERSLPPDQLWPQLDALEAAIAAQDIGGALGLLAQLVPEWQRNGSYTNPELSAAPKTLLEQSGDDCIPPPPRDTGRRGSGASSLPVPLPRDLNRTKPTTASQRPKVGALLEGF